MLYPLHKRKNYILEQMHILRASATSGVLYTIGDAINQTIISKPESGSVSLDWQRCVTFGLIGSGLHGPFFFSGFQLMDKLFGTAPTLNTAIKKALFGQFTIFPCFLSLFLPATSVIIEGRAPFNRFYEKFTRINLNGMAVWIPLNMVNFLFVPPKMRILYINCVGIAWNSYLAYESSSKWIDPIKQIHINIQLYLIVRSYGDQRRKATRQKFQRWDLLLRLRSSQFSKQEARLILKRQSSVSHLRF